MKRRKEKSGKGAGKKSVVNAPSPDASRGLETPNRREAFGVRAALAPLSELAEDFFVGAGEGEAVELFESKPTVVGFGAPMHEFSAIGFQRDTVTGNGVFDGTKRVGGGGAEVVGVVGRVTPKLSQKVFHRT